MSTAVVPGVRVGAVVTEPEHRFADVEVLTATYVVRTACHGRTVYIDEKQLPVDRSLAVACPTCGVARLLVVAGPLATWGEETEW